jgi:DNA-binding transcriptional ArsR family regulator
MHEGPPLAHVAALIGDPTRAQMLAALMGGQALTAGELAAGAGVTKPTASAHLAKLLDGGLLALQAQGRHRYYRLAGADVATLLETLMGLSHAAGVRVPVGPREPALREARQCYDHLAGRLGVALHDGLVERGLLALADGQPQLTPAGEAFCSGVGIDVGALRRGRRPLCRHCLDWSERRPHLGGALGAALLGWLCASGGARRVKGSRALQITPGGLQALQPLLPRWKAAT